MLNLFSQLSFYTNTVGNDPLFFRWSTIWYILGSFLGCLLLFYIGWRIYLFTIHKSKQIALQKPQLIDEKYFLTSDQIKLKWNGSINPNGEYIILYLNDLYTNEDSINHLKQYFSDDKNSKTSVCSFHQRWDEQENRSYVNFNIATTLNDIKQIVEYLNEVYPTQKIILQGQGIGCNIAIYASYLIDNIFKVIAINLITNRKYIKYGFTFKMLLCFGFLFYARKIMILKVNYDLLTNNEQFSNNCNEKYGKNKAIALCIFLQLQKMNRKVFKKINKLKQKTLIYQSLNDFHYSQERFNKHFKNINDNIEIEKWADKKHFLINEKDHKIVFDNLIDWINEKIF